MKKVRALRGAITIEKDRREEILAATKELFTEIIKKNNIMPDDLISVFFTVTPDLAAAFPAEALRQLGYTELPAMSAVEIDVPGALKWCIRVMVYFYSELNVEDIQHVYLREAKKLRPDWAERGN